MPKLTTIASRSIVALSLLVPSFATAETATLQSLLSAMHGDEALQASAFGLADAEAAIAPMETRVPGPGVGVDGRVIVEGESEVEVALSQSFPLGNSRRLSRESRVAESKALREDATQRVAERQHDVATRFYAALHRQERATVLAARRDQLSAAHAALKRREQAGDASAFDVERMGRELRQVTLQLARELLEFDDALRAIEALVQTKGLTALDGTLAPSSCTNADRTSPRIEALSHRVAAAELRVSAAGRGNAPELETHAGWAVVTGAGEVAQGFVAGIGLRIPFWGYGDFAENAARTETRALAAEKALVERELTARASSASSRCTRFLELASQAENAVAATTQLVERAQAGYDAAELSLLELVDAQRALLDDRLEQLTLVASAREAELELRMMMGGWR